MHLRFLRSYLVLMSDEDPGFHIQSFTNKTMVSTKRVLPGLSRQRSARYLNYHHHWMRRPVNHLARYQNHGPNNVGSQRYEKEIFILNCSDCNLEEKCLTRLE